MIPPVEVLNKIFTDVAKSKCPIPVHGTLNGFKFIQTPIKYRGKWRLYLNTLIRKIAGPEVGDITEVTIAFDPKP